MATVHTTLAFGVKIAVSSPLMLDKSIIDRALLQAQQMLNKALLQTVATTLKLVPGVKIELTNAATSLTVDKVDGG